MPCIICRRRIAALPLPVCSHCRDERSARLDAETGEVWVDAVTAPPTGKRIDRRPKYTPAPRTEQPETD